jgi:archaellum component FlaC
LNPQKQADFSHYGKSFQESLASLILEDRSFADRIQEVLETEYFELKYLQVFVDRVFDYRDKYDVHPSEKIMTTVLRTEISDEPEPVQKQTRDFFARIHSTQTEDSEYVKSIAIDFCRKQTLKKAMIESVSLLKTSSFDEISKIINDAIILGAENNFGYDYIADFEKRFELKARNSVSTGWAPIDEITQGGLGKGELGVGIASTGAGKSFALVHLGAEALKAGKTVIHYTLELSDTVIATRYDSCLTGVHLGEHKQFKEMIYDKIQDIPGKLIIKEYPTKSASTKTITNHLESLRKRGEDIGMILLDYADLLRPVRETREKRHDLENIYEEVRGIAQIYECPIYTVSQTNRGGLNAEIITMEAISEAFNKCFVADLIFTISRTIDDRQNGTGRFFIAKNRFGEDGVILPAKIDLARAKMEVFPPNGETIGEIQALTAKKQSENLKERYKAFREGNKK